MERISKYRFILLAVLMLLLGFICGYLLKPAERVADNSVIEAAKPTVAATIKSEKTFKNPALIYFYSKDCSSCAKFRPDWIYIKKKYAGKFEFLEVDVDDEKMAPLNIEFMVSIIPAVYIEDAVFRNRAYINPIEYHYIPRFEDELNRYLEMREILKRGSEA